MKEKFMKKIVVLAMALLILTPAFAVALPTFAGEGEEELPLAAPAASANSLLWGGQEGTIDTETGLGNTDPRQMAAKVINVFLGFLGIIAVVIILLGGFKWMTAGGNEEKVGEAKKLMAAGIIGLVIILAAYSIANFVVSRLINVTTST